MSRRPTRRRRPSSGSADRTSLGQRGEDAAAVYFRDSGFRILERNLVTREAEIDLLVRRKDVLIAVEVKTRRAHLAPEWTVRAAQRKRLERALWGLAGVLRKPPRFLRVDVLAVRAPDADTLDLRHFPGSSYRYRE